MDFSCLDLWISVGSWEQFLLHGFRAVSGWSTGHNWAPPAATCPGRFGVSWRKHRGTARWISCSCTWDSKWLPFVGKWRPGLLGWVVTASFLFGGFQYGGIWSDPFVGQWAFTSQFRTSHYSGKFGFDQSPAFSFSVSGASKSRPRKATAGGWTWEIEKCLMLCQWLGTRSISWRQIGVL